MSAPCGIVAGPLMSSVENLELPAYGRTLLETDLDEKFINEGVETKRFKVRGWGRVHRFPSVQENPGTRFDDRDDDIRQTDREEFVLKDWRHTREEAREGRQIWMQFETMGCSIWRRWR